MHYNRTKKEITPHELVTELKDIKSPSLEQACWLRFTGGEPLRNRENLKGILTILSHLNDYVSKKLDVVIQTNGLTLKNYINDLRKLGDFTSLRILIEVSLKGTNPEEFALLTGAKKELYKRVIEGYEILDRCQKNLGNVGLCARLGIFHDVRDHNAITFVYPDWETRIEDEDESIIMFHPKNWCEGFKRVYRREVKKRGYMAAEYLKLRSSLKPLPNMIRYFVPLVRLNQKNLIIDRSKNGFSHGAYDYACDYMKIPKNSALRIIPSPKSQKDKEFLRRVVKQVWVKFPKDATEMFHLANEFYTLQSH